MKKILSALLIAMALFTIVSCGGAEKSVELEEESSTPLTAIVDDGKIAIDNAFYYTHVSGHKDETQRLAYILFEYEQLETVKYQVAYIACTCRGAEVNYYSVAYIELSKEDGSIAYISYDQDSSGHYTAGMYGDSTETWDGTPAKELFKKFREEKLMGASQESINTMASMHGDVDTYSGATVTPNNAVRMLKELFKYHNKNYMN
ncbi:MAG: hypothetical protein JEY91_15835 [Spirochaetaceae bacterium]|nr:hypothetical protein [Spirochaetaceae bacterium]